MPPLPHSPSRALILTRSSGLEPQWPHWLGVLSRASHTASLWIDFVLCGETLLIRLWGSDEVSYERALQTVKDCYWSLSTAYYALKIAPQFVLPPYVSSFSPLIASQSPVPSLLLSYCHLLLHLSYLITCLAQTWLFAVQSVAPTSCLVSGLWALALWSVYRHLVWGAFLSSLALFHGS